MYVPTLSRPSATQNGLPATLPCKYVCAYPGPHTTKSITDHVAATMPLCASIPQRGWHPAPTGNGQPSVFGRGVAYSLGTPYPYMSPTASPERKKGPPPGFPSLPLQPPRLSLFARLDEEHIREGSRGGVERVVVERA